MAFAPVSFPFSTEGPGLILGVSLVQLNYQSAVPVVLSWEYDTDATNCLHHHLDTKWPL